jgi:hypothetical protein
MDNVIPQDTATPRRTLFAAGRWPERDAMYRRADAIRAQNVPLRALASLEQLYITVSRMDRMVREQQISLESAWVWIAAALITFELDVDDGFALREVAMAGPSTESIGALQARVREWNAKRYGGAVRDVIANDTATAGAEDAA